MRTRLLLVLAPIFLSLTALPTALLRAADAPAVKLPPSGTTATAALVASPRHGEWADVALPGSDVKLHTWVSYPERADKAPVVIVIHEIFGMSDWVRSVADTLAGEGFIAVAPDLLSGFGPDGGGTESFKGDSMRAAFSKLNPDELTKRLNAVRDYGLGLPSAAAKSASIGFCWGGGASFTYATRQPKLNAAVVFYGTPPAKEAMANIQCPVLGCYGKSDNRITSTVEATTKSMAELSKTYDPHVFDGAGHGFLRQQDGQNGANLKAAQEAWPAVIGLLKKSLE
jgi:carboxymethylenebutenolidase